MSPHLCGGTVFCLSSISITFAEIMFLSRHHCRDALLSHNLHKCCFCLINLAEVIFLSHCLCRDDISVSSPFQRCLVCFIIFIVLINLSWDLCRKQIFIHHPWKDFLNICISAFHCTSPPLMERAIEHRDNNDYRTVLLEYISMEWIHHCTQTTYLCYYSMTFHFIRVVLFVLHFVWLLLKKVVLLIEAKVVVISE